MKKLFIALLFALVPFTASASIMTQLELKTVGAYFGYQDTWNVEDNINKTVDFTPMGGFGASVLWEFNSRDTKPLHYNMGLNLSVSEPLCLNLSLVGGLSYKLCDVGKLRLEICPSIEAGPSLFLLGGMFFYSLVGCDFILTSSSRRGFYGGIGLVDTNIINLEIFKGYGVDIWETNVLRLRVLAGVRL